MIVSETRKEENVEEEMPLSKDSQTLANGKGFRTIELVSQLSLAVISKFWKLCMSWSLILLLAFWYYGGVVAFILLSLAVIGIGWNLQDMLLYYPEQPSNSRIYVEMPNLIHLPYENHFIKTRDGVRINMVFIKHTSAGAPTVIYFHGNAGNIGHRLMNAFGLYTSCHCNILLVEYRGYGKSQGHPSESGLYIDAATAMDFLLRRTDVDKNKIFIFGRSLGGAVAVHLASQPYYAQFIAALLLENTFTNLPEIGRNIFNLKILHFIPNFCFKNKFPSKKRIAKIQLPTLFLSGVEDDLIPPKMMQNLHDVSGSQMKRLCRFEGGTHNETWMSPGYYTAISSFMQQVLTTRVHSLASLEPIDIANKNIKTV